MRKVKHLLLRDSWAEYPYENEKILCDPNDTYADPKCTTSEEYVTCKRCLKILAKENEIED